MTDIQRETSLTILNCDLFSLFSVFAGPKARMSHFDFHFSDKHFNTRDTNRLKDTFLFIFKIYVIYLMSVCLFVFVFLPICSSCTTP